MSTITVWHKINYKIYSSEGVVNDACTRLPNLTEASCDLCLSPLTPKVDRFIHLPRRQIVPICSRIGYFVFKVSLSQVCPISASRDLDLWPPDPQSWSFHLLAPQTTCTNLHQYRFIHFQNIMSTRQVTNKWTNGQMVWYKTLCLCPV